MSNHIYNTQLYCSKVKDTLAEYADDDFDEDNSTKFVLEDGLAGYVINEETIFPLVTSDPTYECYLIKSKRGATALIK